MKYLLPLLIALATLPAALAQTTDQKAQPTFPASTISRVTVYAGWAYVTRRVELQATAGRGHYLVADIPSWIDQDSVRAAMLSGDAKILAASARTAYREKVTKQAVDDAQAAVDGANDERQAINKQLEVLTTERDYLLKLMPWKLATVPQETEPRKIADTELKEVANLTAALSANDQKQQALQADLKATDKKLQHLNKALSEARRQHKLERNDLTVDLDAEKGGAVTLEVSYLISGASWYPSYDARTDDARSAVTLGCSAVVQQTTGEDWTDAAFTLSTVNPYASRGMPTLQPWYLQRAQGHAPNQSVSSYQLDNSGGHQTSQSFRLGGNYVGKAAQIQQKMVLSNSSDESFNNAYRDLNLNVDNAVKVIRQAEARGTTAEFTIKGTYSVTSKGAPVKLPVGSAPLTAECRYTLVPVISASTYVSARIQNTASFPFLPGPAYIFVSDSLVGKTDLDLVAQGERFDLYLGLEERIKVDRQLDGSRSVRGLFSGNKRLNLAYSLTVSNLLGKPALVTLRDQLPVSQDDQIKVKLLRAKPEAIASAEGYLEWEMTIPASKSTTITYEYQVECPANVTPAPLVDLERQLEARH